jgi:hypothetical protein
LNCNPSSFTTLRKPRERVKASGIALDKRQTALEEIQQQRLD